MRTDAATTNQREDIKSHEELLREISAHDLSLLTLI